MNSTSDKYSRCFTKYKGRQWKTTLANTFPSKLASEMLKYLVNAISVKTEKIKEIIRSKKINISFSEKSLNQYEGIKI